MIHNKSEANIYVFNMCDIACAADVRFQVGNFNLGISPRNF